MMRFFSQYKKALISVIILTQSITIGYGLRLHLIQKHRTRNTPTVLYSRSDSIPSHLINLIQESKSYVFLAMYTLTHEDLTNALVSAKLRGLEVKVLLDYKQSLIDQSKPQISKLKKYNVVVRIPFRNSGIMHLKTLVTDKGYASGSFNWTNSAAQYNDEVLEIGTDNLTHSRYKALFEKLWDEASLP